jgi:lipopolysaccharide biosynthesis glycosyltransferase
MAVDVDRGVSAGETPDVIQVAMAADREFVLPLAVALTSLALAHRPGDVAVTVLHDGISSSEIERIERPVHGRLEISWRQVNPEEVAGAHFSTPLTSASLFRLLLPRFLPSDAERVIYLDADTVITGSVRPLWETHLGEHHVAAVRDAASPFAAGPCGTDWRGLGLAADAPYFNSGLLVIALGAWRSAGVSARVLEVLRGSRPRWGDQDGLNVVLCGRWKELERRWNLQTADIERRGLAWALWPDDVDQALTDPAVIHYTERDKPWDPGTRHPMADRWHDMLDQTAWSGWRPAHRPLHRRVTSRTKRALRVLTAPPSGPPILR